MRTIVVAAVLAVGAACVTTSSPTDAPPPSPTTTPAPAAPPTTPAAIVAASRAVVGGDVEPDAAVEALLAPRRVEVEARAKRVVGTLAGPLEKTGAPHETSLGNFASDAMRVHIASFAATTVDVCFQNMGGLRRVLDAGPVTEGDLVELMPFDNAIIVFELSGAELEGVLHRAADRGDPVSGARFRRTESGRAVDVTVADAPLDPARTYRVCTNDYVFEGGGGYPLEGAEAPNYTGVLVREAFIAAFEDAARAGAPVAPVVDGRVGP